MPKFNSTNTGRNNGSKTNTVNKASGAAYKVADSKKELAGVILSSMLNGDSYYQSDASRINQVFNLVKGMEDTEFAAKAMIYARQEGNLRSISHVLANAVAEAKPEGFSLRNAIKAAIVRPDDMTEMFALWKSRHTGKMIPNSFRRAFKDMLESGKWDAYQLKKYAKPSADVKLRDIIMVSHPKDKKGLLKGVIEGTLKAPATVESMLSSGKSASATFEEMLLEGRLGYMVAIKNIRNALETGLSDNALDMWCKLISDPRRVERSRMLPFRYVDAWEAVKGLSIDTFKLRKVKAAINKALIASAWNLEFVNRGEKIAIILDDSGSMHGVFKTAITLAAVLYHALPKENVVVYKFATDAKEVDFGLQAPLDIIYNTPHNGGGTYFSKPMELLTRTKTKVDRIVMLSDMQLYRGVERSWYDNNSSSFDQYYNEYRSKVSPNVKFLFWDLQGYGAGTPLELRNDILMASGFSDKLLKVIPKMWVDANALVREIESITI